MAFTQKAKTYENGTDRYRVDSISCNNLVGFLKGNKKGALNHKPFFK